MIMASGDGQWGWQKTGLAKNMFLQKNARRDFMKNAPDGASRSLTTSPFLQKHILKKNIYIYIWIYGYIYIYIIYIYIYMDI